MKTQRELLLEYLPSLVQDITDQISQEGESILDDNGVDENVCKQIAEGIVEVLAAKFSVPRVLIVVEGGNVNGVSCDKTICSKIKDFDNIKAGDAESYLADVKDWGQDTPISPEALDAEAVDDVKTDDDDDEDEGGDDVCDLCMQSDVTADRTTYCGKTIGVECGCDKSHSEGTCDDPNCDDCKNKGKEACAVCGIVLEPGNGDNWDDLCPGHADQVSEYMDEHEASRDRAIEVIREQHEASRETPPTTEEGADPAES